MKKLSIIIILFLLSYVNVFSTSISNEIILYYGIGSIPAELSYNLENVTTSKLVLSEDKLELFDINSDKLVKEIKIKEEEYNEIIKLVNTTIKKEKKIECREIPNDTLSLPNIINKVRVINLVIKINNEEYCTKGKNELLEYLNNKYNFKIKWEKGIPKSQEIYNLQEIKIYYGRTYPPDGYWYNLKDITTNELIISEKKIKLIQINSKQQIKEINVNKKEYQKIGDLIVKVIDENEGLQCKNSFNAGYRVRRDVQIKTIEPIISVINISNDEYCILGKNELLEYLNNNYRLNIEWLVEMWS